MKILFSSASALFSDYKAGGEVQISQAVVRAAAEMGHETVAFAPRVELRIPLQNCTPYQIGGYDLIKERDYFKLRLNWWKYSARCRLKGKNLLKTGRFDIVHHILPSDKGKFSLCSRLGPAFIYGPVFSPWEHMPPEEYGEYARGGTGLICALKSKAADRLDMIFGARLWLRTLRDASIILVELDRTESFIPQDCRHKVRVLSPGIDLSHFPPAPEPEGKPTIVFLALLARRKGLEYLLKAMADVVKKMPELLLLIAGEGPDKEFFDRMAKKLCPGSNVQFLGEVPHHEVPSLLRRAHVFCLPSIGEPYGMSALQAMACAKPVVLTKAGGFPSLIEDGRSGILVPPKDHKSLAEAILKLLSDSDLRRKLGEAGRKVVIENYSSRVMAERLEAIYQEALATKKA